MNKKIIQQSFYLTLLSIIPTLIIMSLSEVITSFFIFVASIFFPFFVTVQGYILLVRKIGELNNLNLDYLANNMLVFIVIFFITHLTYYYIIVTLFNKYKTKKKS
jgi:hypothetical protein